MTLKTWAAHAFRHRHGGRVRSCRPARPCRRAAGYLRSRVRFSGPAQRSSSLMPAPVLAEVNRRMGSGGLRSASRTGHAGRQRHGSAPSHLQVLLGKRVFVFFDNLVDQRPMGGRLGRNSASPASMLQAPRPPSRSAVPARSKTACTACRSAREYRPPDRQVGVVSIDLVDDDHPAQLALSGIAHHALSRQFDPVCALMTISAVSTRPARRWPGRQIRIARCRPDARGCLRGRNSSRPRSGMAGFGPGHPRRPRYCP